MFLFNAGTDISKVGGGGVGRWVGGGGGKILYLMLYRHHPSDHALDEQILEAILLFH